MGSPVTAALLYFGDPMSRASDDDDDSVEEVPLRSTVARPVTWLYKFKCNSTIMSIHQNVWNLMYLHGGLQFHNPIEAFSLNRMLSGNDVLGMATPARMPSSTPPPSAKAAADKATTVGASGSSSSKTAGAGLGWWGLEIWNCKHLHTVMIIFILYLTGTCVGGPVFKLPPRWVASDDSSNEKAPIPAAKTKAKAKAKRKVKKSKEEDDEEMVECDHEPILDHSDEDKDSDHGDELGEDIPSHLRPSAMTKKRPAANTATKKPAGRRRKAADCLDEDRCLNHFNKVYFLFHGTILMWKSLSCSCQPYKLVGSGLFPSIVYIYISYIYIYISYNIYIYIM